MIEATPKRTRGSMRKKLKDATSLVSESPSKGSNCLPETPRKRKLDQDDVEASPSIRAASSVGRSTGRSGTATIVPDGETPRKRRPEPDMFATPLFLRRPASQFMGESLLSSPPVPLPQPIRPGLVKGLSSLMADLRKMQDEILDDEIDNLRELEREASNETKKLLFPATAASAAAGVAQEDPFGTSSGEGGDVSRNTDPIEREHASGGAAEGEAKSGDVPTRVWKKRGLKRQTRRVKSKFLHCMYLPLIDLANSNQCVPCVINHYLLYPPLVARVQTVKLRMMKTLLSSPHWTSEIRTKDPAKTRPQTTLVVKLNPRLIPQSRKRSLLAEQ